MAESMQGLKRTHRCAELTGADIRAELVANPPNAKARFVELSLSDTGFKVSRS